MGTVHNIIGIVICAMLVQGCSNSRRTYADKAFDRMAYSVAATKYDQLLEQKFDRSLALRSAITHIKLNNLHRAIELYAMAQQDAPLVISDALQYGEVLQQIGELNNAELQFRGVLASDSGNVRAAQLLNACKAHGSFIPDPPEYVVQSISVPEMAGVFGATPYGKGIVFAGEKGPPKAKDRNPLNGHSFLDLYFAELNMEGELENVQPLFSEVNGAYHDGPATFSADGRNMLFTRSDYEKYRLVKDQRSVSHVQLFGSEKQRDGTWGEIEQFAFNSDGQSIGQAALTADGNTLFVVSDMPGGFGGTDIYMCKRMLNNWGPPENLGPTINSSLNEMFPTTCGDTLFFSSNGHSGLGGLDIFSTAFGDDEWSIPVNMNAPINSTYDDLSLQLREDGMNGFLSSNRDGQDGIYSLRKLNAGSLSRVSP